MPTHVHATAALSDVDADLLVIPATTAPGESDGDDLRAPVLDEVGAALGERLGVDLPEVCRVAAFDGSAGTSLRVPTRGAVGASMVLVVGLGPADEVSTESIRRAGALVAEATQYLGSAAVSLHLAGGLDPQAAARATVEGIELGAYRFAQYKSKDPGHELATVTLAGGEAAAVEEGIRLGTVSAEATALVRDLVNTPPQDKRPPAYADRILELVADLPIEASVMDEAALVEAGFGGHLGVGAGSEVESRFVELRYRPEGATRHVALVGKGITFDSGGLSLKPPKAMEWMKADMAGSATMLAVLRAAAQLEVPTAITALLCLAENMPSGSATRPGDVLVMNGGKTVEVLNTDAEGRLVMADGLVHAGTLEPRPDVLLDAATLTGAAVVALGPKIGGVFSEDDDLAASLVAAAETAGEPLWRMPMGVAEYAEELKSEVADIRNVGGAGAGSTRAALFLREFVPDGMAWAHLDIAGPAYNDAGPWGYVPKGGTGIPARTLLDWFLAG